MKNLINLFTIACFLLCTDLSAQTTPMENGNNVVMAGIGIGGYGHSYYSTASPTFVLTYQRGIVDNLGPGNLSVGLTMATKSGRYDGYWTDYKSTWFAFSARASYHPHFVKSEKFDLYGGAGLGFYKLTTSAESPEFSAAYGSSSVFSVNVHVGARYIITDQFSVWAELGNHLSFVSVGGAFTF